jgi:low temperature requirement protein LtrA
MGHEAHHHEEKTSLGFFASPLVESSPTTHRYTNASNSDTDLEEQQKTAAHAHAADASQPNFGNMDCSLHENPAFHRHAEATTAELFYDLFFVANLTTFTSMLEINDRHSLTAYVGFFSLLWLTWYQVSLYDVRFSADSVFERAAKAIHFGVMVGFAVIGPQWKPGQAQWDYKIYKAFGLILMVSRLTLFAQYGVTLLYTKKHRITILPILLIMASTLVAAILYGALTPAFPDTTYDLDGVAVDKYSNAYIAWYIIAISETLLTVAVSCIPKWKAISFKGTHMVQRMSLLSLIILGEGIIVICKSISKIVKNEFLWSAAVVGQIIAAVLIIYWYYQLYFDRMQEEHFGSIKQQVWAFLHFPLHLVLVLVLQGVSLLIIWRQAIEAMNGWSDDLLPAFSWLESFSSGTPVVPEGTSFAEWITHSNENSTAGEIVAYFANYTCYKYVYVAVPKGVDAKAEIEAVKYATYNMSEGIDYLLASGWSNNTAFTQYLNAFESMGSATMKTLFDSLSVTVPKTKGSNSKDTKAAADFLKVVYQYYNIFDLVMTYTFTAVSPIYLLNDLPY